MATLLFLHEAQLFHNLSTYHPQTYTLAYPQTYPQPKD